MYTLICCGIVVEVGGIHFYHTVLMCAISTLPLHMCHFGCYFLVSTIQAPTSSLHVQSTFVSFPQNGWTAVLLAARCGHKEVVQELCETFGADFLHRKKVRAMRIIGGSEWLSELCIDRTHAVTLTG